MAEPSVEFQTAVFERLLGDEGVASIVGSAVYDGRPQGPEVPVPSVTFGPNDYTREDYGCTDGPIRTRIVTLQLDAWRGDNARLWPVMELTGAIVAALEREDLLLSSHAVTNLAIEGVRHFLDDDGATGHGVVTLEAEIEEA